MRNQSKIYVVTRKIDLFSNYESEMIQGFFADKQRAKRYLKASEFKGEVKTITPTDYALEFLPALTFGQIPHVFYKGFRDYNETAKAKKAFNFILPNAFLDVKKFSETALFKKYMGVVYA